jgi:hypothetical protein
MCEMKEHVGVGPENIDRGLLANEIYGIAGRGRRGENVEAPRRSRRALNRRIITRNDVNPLIEGRGGRRRMRGRLKAPRV